MFDATNLDPRQFTARSETVSGHCPAARLERLGPFLADREGAVDWRIEGHQDARGRPFILLWVAGRVNLVCQRCLEPFPHAFDSQVRIDLVEREDQLPALEAESDDRETMVMPGVLVVAELVEEQVLLEMPLAPSHPAGDCGATTDVPATGKKNPFAALGALKQRPTK